MESAVIQVQWEQPCRYCLHCLCDIYGKAILVREIISLPGMPHMYTTRYLHEECAIQLEQEANED
jgi:hypothetical protein